MDKAWKTIQKNIVYKNKWLRLYEDEVLRPDQSKGLYSYLERDDAIFVIAVNGEDEIFFVREYRYPLQKTILQLPAGQAEKPTLAESAQAELFEETGLKAQQIKRIGSVIVAPGHDKTKVHIMLATDLLNNNTTTKHTAGNEMILEVVPIHIDKVKKMIASNKIEDSLSLAALSIYFANE